MLRRQFMLGGLAAGVVGAVPRWVRADGSIGGGIEAARANFPYELIKVPGSEATATWRRLKAEQRGVPVVLGDDFSFDRIVEGFYLFDGKTSSLMSREQIVAKAQETLAAAAKLRHPDDLRSKNAQDEAAATASLKQMLADNPNTPLPTISVQQPDGSRRELSREEVLAEMFAPSHQAPLGTWPSDDIQPTPDERGLSVALDVHGEPLPMVYVAMIPADNAADVPAYLNYGGWNACPLPAYHVAALRSWRDRYGTELVGLGFDTFNLRASRRPVTREEALALAREQYDYCADIVDQGVGDLSHLAALLKADPWWYFWWD